MDDDDILLPVGAVPSAGSILNPFLIVDDAPGLIDFVAGVFGVAEIEEARTPRPDGRLIHSEVRMGHVALMVADRMDGWPSRPGLLQVWVRDVAAVLERGVTRGASVVTEPHPFWGETTLGRMLDPWQNLWWLWAPAPGQADPGYPVDEGADPVFATVDRALRAMGDG
ncbi:MULTISPECIES: VOC family protein [Pseudonocardia]|uniref:VOC domain-containing protein n=2 Tax=Pseudonocardia TaxID=1847 RepID=A0A1Y2N5G6_PSEAH|nr:MULTISPECIES: VOC family protein [Pseudonocardia]OSY42158.1 hypothetical protein BG845_01656 [Pseudonocardia autotrophica]TDN75074.1 putative glyoxalase superfamily protein PhnB [Pseudonocardia autotrophica]BBF99018.1 hypothetical protein Pdca_02280 [Pseudonocardia autotrophica]GEC23938.1 hypothetical protein PSA01_09670 [Pseudonocardia saturnea]